jgi:hypothetical protein
VRRALAALFGVLLAVAVQAAPAAITIVSADGRWRLVADGSTLTVFDAGGRAVRTHVAAAADGSGRSVVTALHDAAPRRSFIVLFATLPELWEISYDPQAEPIYRGLVHDYRLREGIAEPGFLNLRRTRLDAPLREAGFDSSRAFVIARAPDRADGQAVLHLLQLDVRRRIAEFTLRGDPDTAVARSVWRDGREILEVPDRQGGSALLIDPRAARMLRAP